MDNLLDNVGAILGVLDFQPYGQIDQILENSEIVQSDLLYLFTAELEVELFDAPVEDQIRPQFADDLLSFTQQRAHVLAEGFSLLQQGSLVC